MEKTTTPYPSRPKEPDAKTQARIKDSEDVADWVISEGKKTNMDVLFRIMGMWDKGEKFGRDAAMQEAIRFVDMANIDQDHKEWLKEKLSSSNDN